MTKTPQTPAEDLAILVAELVDGIHTVADVTRYRRVRRGHDRTVAVMELVKHHTRQPGIIDQLHAVQAATATIPVRLYREIKDRHTGDVEIVYVRTIQRPAAAYGVVTAGAAVPQGSPGWDADGALSPLPSGGSFESQEPATAALDLFLAIRAGVPELRATLGATGTQPSTKAGLRELVGLALTADERDVRHVLARVRSWVSTAKIVLGYEAPIVPLRDMYCRHCGGQLLVRADASSAVWCSGLVSIHGPARDGELWPIGWVPCGASWPRGSWARLLEESQGGVLTS